MTSNLLRIAVIACGTAGVLAHAATQPVIYPAKGQSAAQTDRDKYECYEWSKQQSSFDPMQAQAAPPAQPAQSQSQPQANHSMSGMMKGAAGGAAVAELTDRDAGKGAAIGVLGAATRERIKQYNAQQSQQQAQQQQQQQQAAQMQAARAQQRGTFDRAFGACLEGRGYVVK